MASEPPSSGLSVKDPVVWMSGVVLLGVAGWNAAAGDWMDGLFVLGLGIGGALLLGARRQKEEQTASTVRWTGIALLGLIVLVQLIGLFRYVLNV